MRWKDFFDGEAGEQGKQDKGPRISAETIRALRKQFDGEYRYFQFPEIVKSSSMSGELWEKGKRLAESGRVTLESFDLFYPAQGSRGELCASVTGHSEDGEDRKASKQNKRYWYAAGTDFGSITIQFGRKSLREMDCERLSCPRMWYPGIGSGRICEHEAALLYLAGQYILEHNPGDITDQDANQYLRGVKEPRDEEEEPSDLMLELTGGKRREPLELVPDIVMDVNSPFPRLMFRVGEGKKFRIRDLGNFVRAVDNREDMTFGSKTRFALGPDRFSGRSRKLWDILSGSVRNVEETLAQTGTPGIVDGNFLPLSGQILDDFFDYAAGDEIDAKLDGEKGTLHFREKEAQPKLRIAPLCLGGREDESHMDGIRLSGSVPRLIHGIRHTYWMDEGSINRMSARQAEMLGPLLAAAPDGDIDMRFGRRNLARFMYDILPGLEEAASVTIEDEEKIRSILPAKTKFLFFLDLDGKSANCMVRAVDGTAGAEEEPSGILSPGTGRELRQSDPREKKILDLAARYFPEREESPDGYAYFSTGGREEYLYLLLEEGVQRLLGAGVVQASESFRRLRVRGKASFRVGVQLKSDLLKLEVGSADFTPEEIAEILGAYRKKKKFCRLRSGDFVNLDDRNLESLEAIMQDLNMTPKEFVSGKMNIPAYRTLYLDKMLEGMEGIYAERDTRFKKLVKDFKTVSDADYPVPAPLSGVLRNYQKTGYRWMRTLAESGFGGILADEMGLGKTLQTIAVFEAEREAREKDGASSPDSILALVVCPASLVYNWGEELRHFAPELRVQLAAGTQAERSRILGQLAADPGSADVLVTSYDLLRRDIDQYEDMAFRYQVIDEAQYIKNHLTAQAKAVKLIRSRTRYALTGTPIENRLAELWSIFDYLMPGFFYGYDTFRKKFEAPIVREEDEDARERLSRMIRPFVLRRYKKDVLRDLPEKLEEVRYSKMEPEQRRIYDAQVAHMRQMLHRDEKEGGNAEGQEGGPDRIRILAELTKVREICCDPSLILENYAGGSAKREACMDLIRSAIDEGHRILVFSAFTSMLALLSEDLVAAEIPFYEITGETPKAERVRLVREFNEGDVPVFLISLKAGGTGLNLTGADVVIHYDPWWNLAAQEQATDRAHRIGQTRTVTVYRMIIKDSIEEKILDMQESKQKLADDVLGAGAAAGAISREELLALLE